MTFIDRTSLSLLKNLMLSDFAISGIINLNKKELKQIKEITKWNQKVEKEFQYKCVSTKSMRILSAADLLSGSLGSLVSGDFEIEGLFQKASSQLGADDLLYGTVNITKGGEQIPQELFETDPLLVIIALQDSKISVGHLPFIVQNLDMPLAPQVQSIQLFLANGIQKGLIACPNGLFQLDIKNDYKFSEEFIMKYENVLKIDYVADLTSFQEKGHEEDRRVFRLCDKAIVIAGKSQEGKVAELQRKLMCVANNSDLLNFSQTSSVSFTKGILEFKSQKNCSRDHIQEALNSQFPFDMNFLKKHPLINWQAMPFLLKIHFEVKSKNPSDRVDAETKKQTFAEQLILNEGTFALEITGRYPLPKPAVAGEEAGGPFQRIQNIIMTKTKNMFAKQNPNEFSSERQKEVSQELGDTIIQTLSDSNVFESEINISVEMEFHKVDTTMKIVKSNPSRTTVVPHFSWDPLAIRMALLLCCAENIGIDMKFLSWAASEKNGFKID